MNRAIMVRQAMVIMVLAACGGTPPAPRALPTNVAPTSPSAPDEPYRGALCFGGHGPTDIRAFDRVASRIFQDDVIAVIGACRIVEGPSQGGYREVTVVAGTAPVAVLNLCGGKALVRGINLGRDGQQIGDTTERLAAYPNLECSGDVGGYWCYGATANDPIDRYFIAVPGATTTGQVMQGPSAVALIAGKTIAGASFTTRCD